MVDDLERRRAPGRRPFPRPFTRATIVCSPGSKAVHEPEQRAVGHRVEAGGDVHAVALDAQVLRARRVVMEPDRDEDIAAGHVLRQRRDRLDRRRRGTRAGRGGARGQRCDGDGCERNRREATSPLSSSSTHALPPWSCTGRAGVASGPHLSPRRKARGRESTRGTRTHRTAPHRRLRRRGCAARARRVARRRRRDRAARARARPRGGARPHVPPPLTGTAAAGAGVESVMRALGLLVLASAATIALGSGGSASPVRLTAPAGVTAGLPMQVTVHAPAAPDAARIVARSGALRREFSARRDGRGTYRATVALPQPGRWSLVARVGRLQSAPKNVTARAASARHPYAVARAGVRTFVADGATGRVLQLGSRGLAVHARGLSEPTGLAGDGAVLYVADFAANLVRRIDARGRVTALAAVPQVASVAVARSGTLYAVAIDGPLVRISPAGAVTRIADLDRPHGVAVDRDGTLLVAEDSTRVRRVDPANGRSEVVVTSPGVNRDRSRAGRHALPRRDDARQWLAAARRLRRHGDDADRGPARRRHDRAPVGRPDRDRDRARARAARRSTHRRTNAPRGLGERERPPCGGLSNAYSSEEASSGSAGPSGGTVTFSDSVGLGSPSTMRMSTSDSSSAPVSSSFLSTTIVDPGLSSRPST